jgi:predicted SAM-dependent methyltransferase
MTLSESTNLNIGAGISYLPGFTNIDISDKADVQLDLNSDRLSFDDNSVDLVFTYHCLEHLDNYLFALGEIHRVLRHEGTLLMGVPYVTLTEFNLVNPYHKQNFNEYSFDFFGDWCRRHLFNVVRAIDFGLVAVKERGTSIVIDDEMRASMQQQFDQLLAACVPYQ